MYAFYSEICRAKILSSGKTIGTYFLMDKKWRKLQHDMQFRLKEANHAMTWDQVNSSLVANPLTFKLYLTYSP